jgi:hypothetical protein
MATIREPGRELPVRGQWDVVVAGGGLGGIAAALAAARAGASTLLIERNAFLGGVATAGMCCSIFNCYYTSRGQLGPKGIPVEIADRLAEATGYGQAWHRHKGHVIYDIEKAKLVFEDLLAQAGVGLLLGVPAVGASVEDGRLRALVIESKAGREALLATCVVDATGDADVAVAAGAAVHAPAKAPGHVQSLCFMLGNVDVDAFAAYFRDHPTEYPDYMDVDWTLAEALRQYDECGTFLFPHGGGMQMTAFRQARADGALTPSVGLHDTTDACQMHLLRGNRTAHVITGFSHFDGLDPERLSRSVVDGRRMAFQVADVYRRYIPGFAKAFVCGVAANLGVRFSRRIEGRALLSRAGATPGVRSADSVGRCVAYSHQTKHPGKGAWGVQVMSPDTFDVPLGCLVPKGVDALLVGAGRSAATEEYWLLRAMVPTMVVGQGAGVTAAVCTRTGATPSRIDSALVQAELQRQGVAAGLP